MKKTISILLSLLMVLGLTACGESKAPITAEKFISQMKERGFAITDATDQFAEGITESVTIASNDKYQIEFYVLPSKEQAASVFANNKEAFEALAEGISSHVSKNIGGYNYFSLTTSEGYFLIARIDNTFLYAAVMPENKKDVTEVVQLLGY